jgi:hypothetical protein
VGHEQQVEMSATGRPQPPGRGVVLARVDEHPGARGLDEERVPLTDVDGGDGEGPDREPPADQGSGRTDDGDGRHRRHRPSEAAPPRWRQQPHSAQAEQQERHRPGRARDPADVGERVGGPQHGTGGDPSDGEEPPGGAGRDLCDDTRDERPGDRHRGGRDGEHVGRDRGQRDLTEGEHEQGHDRQLRSDGDPRDLRQAPWEPVEAVPHERCEDEHARRGARREQQSQGPGQHRVDEHEDQHRARERVPRVPWDAPGTGEEHDRPHRRGAQDGRLEAGEEGERHEGGEQRPPPTSGADPQQTTATDDPGRQDRRVRARHRGQVGQPRRLHGVGLVVRQPPGVAGHEPGEEPAHLVGQAGGRGHAHPFTRVLTGAGERPRSAQAFPPVRVQDDGGVLPGEPPAVAPLGDRPRRGSRLPPLPERRRIALDADRGPFTSAEPRDLVDADQHVPAVRGRTRLVDDRGHDRDRPALGRQPGQEPVLARRGPHCRARHPDHDHDDDREEADPRPPRRRDRITRCDAVPPGPVLAGRVAGTGVRTHAADEQVETRGGRHREHREGDDRGWNHHVTSEPRRQVIPEERAHHERAGPEGQRSEHLAERRSPARLRPLLGGVVRTRRDVLRRAARRGRVRLALVGVPRPPAGMPRPPAGVPAPAHDPVTDEVTHEVMHEVTRRSRGRRAAGRSSRRSPAPPAGHPVPGTGPAPRGAR